MPVHELLAIWVKLGHAGHPGTADELQLQLNKLIDLSTGD